MENADEKICPECAETVKVAAIKCRFCGHVFGSPVEEPVSAETDAHAMPDNSGMAKKGCLWIVGILAVLIVVAALLPEGKDGSTSRATASRTNDIMRATATVVSARDLASAYDRNEVAAQQQYGDQVLEVTGTVEGISLDFLDNPVIQFRGVNQFLNVQAKLVGDSRSRAGGISKGQTITVRCESVSEVISAPMLDDCQILQ